MTNTKDLQILAGQLRTVASPEEEGLVSWRAQRAHFPAGETFLSHDVPFPTHLGQYFLVDQQPRLAYIKVTGVM